MLALKPDQIATIGSVRFQEKVRHFLARHFPERYANTSEAELNAFITQTTQEAESHGFASERDIAVYLLAAWLLGNHFMANLPSLRAAVATFPSPRQKAMVIEMWALQTLTLQHHRKPI